MLIYKIKINSMPKLISKNTNYLMYQIDKSDHDLNFMDISQIKTIFVHSGEMDVYLEINSESKHIKLLSNEGINIMPNVKFSINAKSSLSIVVQSSKNKDPIIEISDNNGQRSEEQIEYYKIIKNPKRVNKPWGHEIWITWFKNHHVLKRIFMEKGNKCSLQYHEEKSETNLIIEGKANVLKDIKLQKGISEKEALDYFNEIEDLNYFMKEMESGDYWNNDIFEIHRVYSLDSYTAYEASTYQLDDVIRLQDDNNRVSGFIQSEHN